MPNSLRKMSSIYEKLLFFLITDILIDEDEWVCLCLSKTYTHTPPWPCCGLTPVTFLPTPVFVFYRCKFTLTTKACHTDPDMRKMFLSTCDWSCTTAILQKDMSHGNTSKGRGTFFQIITVEAAWAQREKNISPVSTQPKSKNTSVMVSGLSR